MEFKQLLNILKIEKKILLFGVVGGLASGLVFMIIPARYIAIGSIYVSRLTEQKTLFTYEGYYAQQNAVAYTNTVVSLVESPDVQSKSLSDLNIKVNEYTLRRYGNNITVKKSGPQLITLSVKGTGQDSAVNLWKSITTNTIKTTEQLNAGGDKKMVVSLVAPEPVLKREYKPWYLCIVAGILVGVAISTSVIAAKHYLKEER